MCSLYDCDGAAFETRTWRRARKAHECYACDDPVRAGDRYHVTSSKDDGEIETYKHCARCWSMIEALWASGVEAVQWNLNCGETFEDPPDDMAELAFLTPDEMQARLDAKSLKTERLSDWR